MTRARNQNSQTKPRKLVLSALLLVLPPRCNHSLPGVSGGPVCLGYPAEVHRLELRYPREDVVSVAGGPFNGVAVESKGLEVGQLRELVYLGDLVNVVAM